MTNSEETVIGRSQARQDRLTLIHLFSLVAPDDDVIRFTGDSPDPIHFGGNTYAALPVDISGFAWKGNTGPIRPSLTLANIPGQFDFSLDDPRLMGKRITRIVSFIEECDPPHGDGGGSCFTPECWKIDRLARLDQDQAVFDLVAEADLFGKSLPARVMLRDLCQHRYRVWDEALKRFDYTNATCPYTGNKGFDSSGHAVSLRHDHCSLELDSGCKKRFAGSLPFLGFPGIGGS